MESSAKRRLVGGDDPRCRPSKIRPAEADPEVIDEEVEEFFSIIRRVHDARRSVAIAPAAGPRWSPAFALEDFAGPDAAVARDDRSALPAVAAAEPAASPRRLDLNADPEPEDMAESAPRGEATSRCARSPA